MDFETTTCISVEHRALLSQYCEKLDIPLRTFVVYCIMYAAKHEKKKEVAFKRISYRKRDADNPWKRVHLELYQSEYEFFLDVKKLWKMSLANIIAYCVDNVLFEFFEYFSKQIEKIKTDNYLSYYENRSYSFNFYRVKGIHCLKFYWGPPPEMLRKSL